MIRHCLSNLYKIKLFKWCLYISLISNYFQINFFDINSCEISNLVLNILDQRHRSFALLWLVPRLMAGRIWRWQRLPFLLSTPGSISLPCSAFHQPPVTSCSLFSLFLNKTLVPILVFNWKNNWSSYSPVFFFSLKNVLL